MIAVGKECDHSEVTEYCNICVISILSICEFSYPSSDASQTRWLVTACLHMSWISLIADFEPFFEAFGES